MSFVELWFLLEKIGVLSHILLPEVLEVSGSQIIWSNRPSGFLTWRNKSTVVYQVKPPLVALASRMELLQFWFSSLVMCMGKQWKTKSLGLCFHVGPRRSSWLQASGCPSSGCAAICEVNQWMKYFSFCLFLLWKFAFQKKSLRKRWPLWWQYFYILKNLYFVSLTFPEDTSLIQKIQNLPWERDPK